MRYSFNAKGERLVFAGAKDLNASYKDLAAVCDSIRYRSAEGAMALLDGVADAGMPIEFKRNNKGMGSRHELHGRKGRYPKKCAAMVRKVLANAMAVARSKGYDDTSMFVVHASANKTQIVRRSPSKGMLYHSDSYGYPSTRHSDIELSKVEIGLAVPEDVKLGKQAMLLLKRSSAMAEKLHAQAKAAPQKPKQKPKPAVPKPPKTDKPVPANDGSKAGRSGNESEHQVKSDR